MKHLVEFGDGKNKKLRTNNSLFSNFFDDLTNMNDLVVPGFFSTSNPIKVDIKENENDYLIEAEIPGAKKDDIKLKLEDDIITISVNKEEEIKEEKENYIRRERSFGSYSRSFNLGAVDEESVDAKFEDGILKINIKKSTEKEEKGKSIEIK